VSPRRVSASTMQWQLLNPQISEKATLEKLRCSNKCMKFPRG